MNYFGEIMAILVAFSWTCTALFFEYAGKRIGSLQVNLIRLVFAGVMLSILLQILSGHAYPAGADLRTWMWLSLSGLVGFVFGDLCLFYAYTLITSRFSQLIMTLAPPFAALFSLLLLNEHTNITGWTGMAITLLGIAISVLKKSSQNNEKRGLVLHLPLSGILLALGGAIGQGLGIVLSKKGMLYYELSINTHSMNYIPFAATQIRVITGIIGFTAIILINGAVPKLAKALCDKKGMWATFGGSFFGPFMGVSLSLTAVRYTQTGIASTIMATVPILILIPYAILYKLRPRWIEVLGAVLCVLGVACFFIR